MHAGPRRGRKGQGIEAKRPLTLPGAAAPPLSASRALSVRPSFRPQGGYLMTLCVSDTTCR